ncbi:MAG: 30S ribosomal protein S21 [Candidatus Shikimatogenerans sp. JK-2022]|nr:30S ribosomal protein S21 [Candidatus Shikimatogenerans bostrichidophilus]
MKLITKIKEGQSIEIGLKKYKNKLNKLNLLKNYKKKLFFVKPSILKRLKKLRKQYLIKKKYEK